MRFLVFLLITALPLSSGAELSVVDDKGRMVRLAKPAQRIVSLAPHITELFFAAGAGNSLIAVSDFSDYPESAATLPRVSRGSGIDLERIVSLQPDLVVAWSSGNPVWQLEQLERLGIKLFYSEPSGIEGIASSLQRFGALAGSEVSAGRAAEGFRQRVADMRERFAKRRRVSAFYQIGQDPLMTVNGNHMISHWLDLCGADNVFADLSSLAPVIDIEAVLARNPEVIIAGWYPETLGTWKQVWRRWPHLRAVAGGHLYAVPVKTLGRQTPRAADAALILCEQIDRTRG